MLEDKHFTSIKVKDNMVSYYGDGCLIYNELFYGELVPSLRLNAIMEGNEDYEKLLLYKNAVDKLSKKYCGDFNCKSILKPYFDKLFDGAAVTNYEKNLCEAEYALNLLLELAMQGIYLERTVKDNQIEITMFAPKGIDMAIEAKRVSFVEAENYTISKFITFSTNKLKIKIIIKIRTSINNRLSRKYTI